MIVKRRFETYSYTVVYVLDSLAIQLPLKENPRLRVAGVIGAAPFALALQPAGGMWYLLLSRKLLQQSGYTLGQRAMVRFRVEPQDTVRVPEALKEALAADKAMKKLWDALTPGKQRGYAWHIASAKSPATIQKRIEATFASLLNPAPRPKRKAQSSPEAPPPLAPRRITPAPPQSRSSPSSNTPPRSPPPR
jgi:hypothetical protein